MQTYGKMEFYIIIGNDCRNRVFPARLFLLTVILRRGSCGCVELQECGGYLQYGRLEGVLIWQ